MKRVREFLGRHFMNAALWAPTSWETGGEFHAGFCWTLALNQGSCCHYRAPPALKVLPLGKCMVPSSPRVILRTVRTDPQDSGELLGSGPGRGKAFVPEKANWIGMGNFWFLPPWDVLFHWNECFWLNSICMQISAFSNPMGDWLPNR